MLDHLCGIFSCIFIFLFPTLILHNYILVKYVVVHLRSASFHGLLMFVFQPFISTRLNQIIYITQTFKQKNAVLLISTCWPLMKDFEDEHFSSSSGIPKCRSPERQAVMQTTIPCNQSLIIFPLPDNSTIVNRLCNHPSKQHVATNNYNICMIP